jgi:Dyp-type peroxidase family
MAPDVYERVMLEDLQSNILKSHGRNHTRLVFLRFEDGVTEEKAKAFVGTVGSGVTSAWRQLCESEQRRNEQVPGATVVNLGLSAAGYDLLGYAGDEVPEDRAFRDGMRTRRERLADPVVDAWSINLQPIPHLVVAFADDSSEEVDVAVRAIHELAARHDGVVNVVAEVRGRALREAKHGHSMEHFGYVDGRSQPLVLQEEIDKDRNESGGPPWDPGFPLKTVLVKDPNVAGWASYGSYLVFRKLEQDVAGFKAAEQRLARGLGLVGDEAERAGALVVGRFEDGTPLVLKDKPVEPHPVPNDFDYTDDPEGVKCPFASHIRKVNPRGGSVGTEHETLADERAHLFPRRGVPYDERPEEEQEARPTAGELAARGSAEGGDEEKGPHDFPSRGVGLLFMCYNASIERQFEYMQSRWANDRDYLRPGTGIDPIIGQLRDDHAGQLWPPQHGEPDPIRFSFGNFVTMKGGEYFFVPSLSFLKSLKPPEPKDEFSDHPVG